MLVQSRMIIVASVVGGALVLGLGCQSKGPPPTQAVVAMESGVTSGTRLFTDDSIPMLIVPGEMFAIRLPSNPDAGNQWRLVNNTPPLLEVSEARVVVDQSPPSATNPILGRGGYEYWTFNARGKGITQISFERQTPGKTNAIERKLFQVRIR